MYHPELNDQVLVRLSSIVEWNPHKQYVQCYLSKVAAASTSINAVSHVYENLSSTDGISSESIGLIEGRIRSPSVNDDHPIAPIAVNDATVAHINSLSDVSSDKLTGKVNVGLHEDTIPYPSLQIQIAYPYPMLNNSITALIACIP